MQPHQPIRTGWIASASPRYSALPRWSWRRPAAAAAVAFSLSGCAAVTPSSAGDADASAVAVPADVVDCASFAADGTTVGGAAGVPALRLPCLVGGQEVALDDLGGRPVLVNLWASWCGPCREEIPLLQAAFERYGDRVGFLGVITEDSRSAGVSLLVDLGVTYAQVVDEDRELLDGLAARGLPVTLAGAADGRVVDRQVGPVSSARLEELVSLLTVEATGP